MNVSIYNCAFKIVNILAAFCVFQFSRIALNNNNNKKNQQQHTNPLYYEIRTVSLRRCNGVVLLGTINPYMFIWSLDRTSEHWSSS